MKGRAFYATVEIHPRLLDPQANIKTSTNIRIFLKVVQEYFFLKKWTENNNNNNNNKTRQKSLYPRPLTSYETGYKMVVCTLEIGYCFLSFFLTFEKPIQRKSHSLVWKRV